MTIKKLGSNLKKTKSNSYFENVVENFKTEEEKRKNKIVTRAKPNIFWYTRFSLMETVSRGIKHYRGSWILDAEQRTRGE
jgi:hypothetical protein